MNNSKKLFQRIKWYSKKYWFFSFPVGLGLFAMFTKSNLYAKAKYYLFTKPTYNMFSSIHLNEEINDYFSRIFSSVTIQKNFSIKVENLLNLNEAGNDIKQLTKQIIDDLSKDKVFLDSIKKSLNTTLSNAKLSNLSVKFMSYVVNHYKTEEDFNKFIYYILTSDEVIEKVSLKAMECCRIAMNHPNTEANFQNFIKESLLNEELMKFLYSKTFDFFSKNINITEYKF